MGNERFYKLLLWLVVLAIAGLIYWIAGKNKREEKSVPVGMQLLANPPFQRYLCYSAGIILFLFLELIVVIAILDGALETAGGWIVAAGIAGVVFMALFIFLGRCIYKSHIFFDEEKIMIGHVFSDPDVVQWREISAAKVKKGRVMLYDAGGQKCLDAASAMVGFEEFQDMVERKCSHFL